MSPGREVRPPEDHPSFAVLAAGLEDCRDSAWRVVVQRYTPRLIALARRRMSSRLRQKLSAEDVVQSMYRSFIGRHQVKPYYLKNWDSLWGLLVVMTVRKVSRKYEHFRTKRRDMNREAPLMPPGGSSSERTKAWTEPVDRTPTPAEVEALMDTLRGTLSGLDERERRIVELGLLGMTDREISEEVERTQYRVRQVQRHYTEILQESAELNADGAASALP
jgi:RNA polymerase sigma factor (sigma-70 family)